MGQDNADSLRCISVSSEVNHLKLCICLIEFRSGNDADGNDILKISAIQFVTPLSCII